MSGICERGKVDGGGEICYKGDAVNWALKDEQELVRLTRVSVHLSQRAFSSALLNLQCQPNAVSCLPDPR